VGVQAGTCGQRFITSSLKRKSRNVMTELEQELAKVPEGMRYIDAPNFPAIQKLLKEGTPMIPTRVVQHTTLPMRKPGESLTPTTDGLRQDLCRVVADVLDFNYPASGTSNEERMILVETTDTGVSIKITFKKEVTHVPDWSHPRLNPISQTGRLESERPGSSPAGEVR
jgi:hypothetical protein